MRSYQTNLPEGERGARPKRTNSLQANQLDSVFLKGWFDTETEPGIFFEFTPARIPFCTINRYVF